MPQQTALQDLIRELKQFAKFPGVDGPTIQAAIEFAELRLSTEKEQIESAWDRGQYIAETFPQRVTEPGYESNSEEYFNETYHYEQNL
jgi:hypothetical protein